MVQHNYNYRTLLFCALLSLAIKLAIHYVIKAVIDCNWIMYRLPLLVATC